MQRITIGRYRTPDNTPDYAGYIEGVRDDGTEWIMFLDHTGSPAVYWAERGNDGGVVGDPVHLSSA